MTALKLDSDTIAALEPTRRALGASSPTEAVRMLVTAAERPGVREVIREALSASPGARYLQNLCWDGVPRIEGAAAALLGDHSAEGAANLREWMMSAVERAFHPGCKVARSLLIVGPQGSHKTHFLRALVPTELLDDAPSAEAWVVCVDDFQPAGELKSFLRSVSDTYRTPYGRPAAHPRAFVVAAMAIEPPQETRPFWVVRAPNVDVDATIRDRYQLWAEAAAALKS